MKKLLLTAAITLTMPFAAQAGSEFVEGEATLAGEAELGATLTTGNTDTSSFKARLALKQELDNWENQYVLEGLYKEDSEEVTAKRYFLGVQGNYQINDVSYLFANTNYEVDPFTGYDFTSTTSAGYGQHFIDTDRMSLKAEAGPGYIYQQLDEESALAEGYDSEDSVVAHAVIDFQTKISDSSKFQQRFVADWGSKLDARSETSLTANIVGALAMKFAVIVRYNSEPLDDKKSTDTETNMTLLYAF
jgi:putative salt-induced outer membrane protein YdiY